MDIPEFPSNNVTSKKGRTEDKNISSVVSGGAVRRKKSLRKQFTETFVAGDAKTAVSYALFEVMVPMARDLIADTIMGGIETLLRGDSRRRTSYGHPSGPTGQINYSRLSMGSAGRYASSAQRAMSRQARARHNFDEIVLTDRVEAEDVINQLFELVSKYESASVGDLYELVGLTFSHTDNKWGWTDLTGAGVTRIRGGFLLDLPEPEPLD